MQYPTVTIHLKRKTSDDAFFKLFAQTFPIPTAGKYVQNQMQYHYL